METTFTFRVDADLKKSFETAATAQDQTSSQLLRAFMRDYCAKHAQAELSLAKAPAAKRPGKR
jgi:predicted transcriptional regulator